MEAIEWLERNVMGFGSLSRADRTAINHFQLLWSLFEQRVLDSKGSASVIQQAMQKLAAEGRLDVDRLHPALTYFRDRYFRDGEFTFEFNGLNLRGVGMRGDRPDLVQSVLTGSTQDPAELATGVLIIVYRFRNNLHHGLKWAYGIRGQRLNFRHAGRVLMAIMEMWGNDPPLQAG